MLRHTEGTTHTSQASDQDIHTCSDHAFQAGHAGSIPVTRSTY
jgi:hypothetical protein